MSYTSAEKIHRKCHPSKPTMVENQTHCPHKCHLTPKPNKNNLDWSNDLRACLDENIIGDEVLIDDANWVMEDLDSDAEVKAA